MDVHGERKQVKVRKENSNEPGRVAFWWLRRSSPRDDEVWERLRNSNVDMESAGARMLWITRSISCENGEKFAGHEARKKERNRERKKEKEREREQKSFAVSFACFDVRVFAQPLRSLFTPAICDKIDFINSWWVPQDKWCAVCEEVLFIHYIWIYMLPLEILVGYSYKPFR